MADNGAEKKKRSSRKISIKKKKGSVKIKASISKKSSHLKKHPAWQKGMPAIDRILVPTDFSEESLTALRYALLFTKGGAKLQLLHVVASAATLFAEYPSFFPAQEISKALEERAVEELGRIAKERMPDAVEVETVLKLGTPSIEIISFARTNKIDLIIMATHGKSALKHIFLGSTAERVVRKAPCPVLTVKRIKE
jgi:nucleotide-binding universal stress UspA family protein